MASTPPKIASVANPVALMSMPDRMPAPAPKIWYQTSILPWVAARTSGRVPCTTGAVPETGPVYWRWQPHGTHVQPDDETDSTHAVVVGAHVYRGHGHDRDHHDL